jgi:hypothetical protein
MKLLFYARMDASGMMALSRNRIGIFRKRLFFLSFGINWYKKLRKMEILGKTIL